MSEKTTPQIARLAVMLADLKGQKQEYETKLKEVNSQIDATEIALHGMMVDAGLSNCKVAGVGTIFFYEEIYAKILDEPKFFTYLRETNQDSIIKETVHYQTLKAFSRELIDKNVPGLKIYNRTVARLRRETR